MPRRTATPPAAPVERIVDIDVAAEMQDSFLEYAYSVIYSRALPDARDGLKPVQRRILYRMAHLGLRPDRGHVKSARVVGDVMGTLHPHGDQAIYDALVRMAQDFSLRLPMVDGHGNFGSLSDGPAAQRYTECRMTPAALEMTTSLDEDVVDFVPNYDGQDTEPAVLPAGIPNLLVNGASGIAVGMATNMAPHNLSEVIAAARHLLKSPDARLDTLMRHVPGPDLPSGGLVIGLDGIREIYETGRGSFRMRARTSIEQVSPRRQGIVITELPYNVGPERVIERLKEAVDAKRIQGIADVTDLSDHDHGLRLVIEIKSGFNPQAVLENLYRLTPLEEQFNVNAVALVDGQPRTLGLKELLGVFLDHRITVVRRRSQHRRTKAADRLHLVEGLLVAIVNIDEVIAVIRSSDDAAAARDRLISVFDLTEAQATYILDLPLRRLTKLSRLEMEREGEALRSTIEQLDAILSNDSLLKDVVGDELAAIAKSHGTPRRTTLLEDSGAAVAAAIPLEVPDEPCWVALSASGLLGRTPDASGWTPARTRQPHDAWRSRVATTARASVGLVTSTGRMVRLSVLDLPLLPTGPGDLAAGAPANDIAHLEPGEFAVAVVDLADPDLWLATRGGVVKHVAADVPASAAHWSVIRLEEGDAVVAAHDAAGQSVEVLLITTDAQLLRFDGDGVRAQGRPAGGVAGIRLTPGAHVLYAAFLATRERDGAVIVTVSGSRDALPGTQAGSAKVTSLSEIPSKGRATAGVRAHTFRKGEDLLQAAWIGVGPARALSASGAALTLPDDLVKRDATGTPLTSPVAHIGSGAPWASPTVRR